MAIFPGAPGLQEAEVCRLRFRIRVSMGRWRVALRLIGMGWYVGICLFLGVWGGLWLDNKLNTRPILVIVGLIFGLIIAFYGVYQMVLPSLRNRGGENG